MSRILFMTVDRELVAAVDGICGKCGWELVVMSEFPPPDSPEQTFDLVTLDVRPSPNTRLSFVDTHPFTMDVRGPLRSRRVLILGHYENLVGRMTSFVNGANAYFRIHPMNQPPEPKLADKLEDALRDALALPEYVRVDFHDAFPNREFYRQVFESIQIPIVIMNSEGIVRLMNLRALARFNYYTQMVINQSWMGLIAPSDRGKRAEDFLIRISSGYFYEGTLRFVDRRGHEFPGLVTSSRVFSTSLETELLIILAIHDLTEMEELQRQVTAFQKMESVERVVAGMTHEFNNMLTAILGHAELLTQDLPVGTETHESARVIRQEAERARELTGRLLGLSSTRQFVPGRVSCNEVVRETQILLRHSLGDPIKVETQLMESGDIVEGDANQLRQVLVNLCLNARDAMDGKGLITIRTGVREVTAEECGLHQDWTPGIFVEMCVRDTGCGIDPDVLPRVFEPFFTTKPDGAGTGLGLSVARGIVRTHGGHVAIESALGQGTAVMVRLPQGEVQTSQADTGDEETGIVRPAAQRGACILVVDDDRAVLTFAQKVLERAGYRVRMATHGLLALDTFEHHQDEVALIVLDLTMPGTTGREVLQGIRQIDKNVPIILCTGFALGGVDDDLVSQVQGFLKKPYRPQDLVEQIGEVLAARQE
jgi:two-component system, cell cycle sensor histidine kinase and response regulator CckA